MRAPVAPLMAGLGLLLIQSVALGAADAQPPWHDAWREKGPMSAEETRALIERLARFVFDNHLKTDRQSPQRGMIYEYFNVARKGHYDQFIQGEALDTMHDGAWFAAAMVNAARATGEPFYRQVLADWQMPFYCKMLNHSDELFTNEGAVARKGARPWGKPWAYQEGEKGFIPYFWDDGGSVSLERRRSNNPLGIRPCHDNLAGKPNPKGLLDGYSLGMSNHMAQDIGVMVMLAWLLFKDGEAPEAHELADTIAEAAMNLHQSRVRHHGFIPMCVAPAALANRDPKLMRRVPDPEDERYWAVDNRYVRALYRFEPGKRYAFPGFADDIQYTYYYSIARSGGDLTKPIAFRTIYDAFTEPMLYRYYCDDQPPAPGINRFDYKGYIPTGMGTGQEWDGFSDTGGYAHLVSAAAQWLFLLSDRRDWAVHNIPETLPPE